MSNPWEDVPLHAYEQHMSMDSVCQLQTLNQIMRKQLTSWPVDSAAVLGVAGGNGLEHGYKLRKIVGIDINGAYLEECRQRYASTLGERLILLQMDLSLESAELPDVGLVIANLFLEYVGGKRFCNLLQRHDPPFVSCTIQQSESDSFVSPSPYAQTFDGISQIHHDIQRESFIRHMKYQNYLLLEETAYPLPDGKQLLMLTFRRSTPEQPEYPPYDRIPFIGEPYFSGEPLLPGEQRLPESHPDKPVDPKK